MAGVVAGGGSGGLMRRSTALPQQPQETTSYHHHHDNHAAVHLQHRASLPPLSVSFLQQEQQRKEFLMDLQRNRQRHSSWLQQQPQHHEKGDERSMSLQEQLSQFQSISKDSDDWKDNPSLSYWMQGLDDDDQDVENDLMREHAKNDTFPLPVVDAKSGKESPLLSQEEVSGDASALETPGADQDDDTRPSSPLSSTNALVSERHPPASPVAPRTTNVSLVSSTRQDQASPIPTNTTKTLVALEKQTVSSPVSVMDLPRTVVLSSSSTSLRQYKIQQIKQDLQARRRAARNKYSSSKDQQHCRVSKVDHTMVLRDDNNNSNDGSSTTSMVPGHYSGPLNDLQQMHGPGIFCSQDGRLYVGEFRANVFWQGVVSQGRLSSTTSNKTKTRRRQRRQQQRVQV